MKRVHLFAAILLLSAASLAQQTPSTGNPDTSASPSGQVTQPSPNDQSYNRAADQPYNRPVETGHNWGGWGLLGLLGLGGLLGRRRDTTTGTTYTRDERTYGQQRRAS